MSRNHVYLQQLISTLQQLDRNTQYDEYLYSLIEILQYLAKTNKCCGEWLNYTHVLIHEIQGSRDQRIKQELKKCSHPQYQEDLNDTLYEVIQYIEEFKLPSNKYETKKTLIRWINWATKNVSNSSPDKRKIPGLGFKVKNLNKIAEEESKLYSSLDEQKFDKDGNSVTLGDFIRDKSPSTLEEIENFLEDLNKWENRISVGKKLMEYIKTDPNGRLRNSHPPKYPECHVQMLAQRRLLKFKPDKFSQIAKDCNIKGKNPGQVPAEWWRNTGISLLQEIARELGYQIQE